MPFVCLFCCSSYCPLTYLPPLPKPLAAFNKIEPRRRLFLQNHPPTIRNIRPGLHPNNNNSSHCTVDDIQVDGTRRSEDLIDRMGWTLLINLCLPNWNSVHSALFWTATEWGNWQMAELTHNIKLLHNLSIVGDIFLACCVSTMKLHLILGIIVCLCVIRNLGCGRANKRTSSSKWISFRIFPISNNKNMKYRK